MISLSTSNISGFVTSYPIIGGIFKVEKNDKENLDATISFVMERSFVQRAFGVC